MHLDFDVLFIVMGFLESSADIASLMRTCHTMRSAGVIPILSTPIRLRTTEAMKSFYLFVSTDMTYRGQLVRDLSIQCTRLHAMEQKQAAADLVNILPRMSKIDTLLLSPLDGLLKVDDRFRNVLRNLQKIRSFKVHHVGWGGISVLQNLRSHPIRLHVVFDGNQLAGSDTAEHLSRLAPFLQHLSVHYPEFHTAVTPYHCLRSLYLEDLFSPRIDLLGQFFPNLKKLTIIIHHNYPAASAIDVRNDNLIASTGWPDLDTLHGDILSLWCAGVCTKVRFLAFDVGLALSFPRRLTQSRILRFQDVINDTRPEILKIDIPSRAFVLHWGVRTLVDASDSLSHLSVTVGVDDRYTDISLLLVSIALRSNCPFHLMSRYRMLLRTSCMVLISCIWKFG